MKKDDIYKPNISGIYSSSEDVYSVTPPAARGVYGVSDTLDKQVYGADENVYKDVFSEIYGKDTAELYAVDEEDGADENAQKAESDSAP